MLVLLYAGFVDSYWIFDAFWSQKRNILHFFADFDFHYNVMNMELRFRSLSVTVHGTPNFVSMILNLDLLDLWGHTKLIAMRASCVCILTKLLFRLIIFFLYKLYKQWRLYASNMAAMQISQVVTISPHLIIILLLKLTCHHINRRHFCFNIKSISVHPLLWMNVMLDFICMVFAGMCTTFR